VPATTSSQRLYKTDLRAILPTLQIDNIFLLPAGFLLQLFIELAHSQLITFVEKNVYAATSAAKRASAILG
jgi:hypothetical protein